MSEYIENNIFIKSLLLVFTLLNWSLEYLSYPLTNTSGYYLKSSLDIFEGSNVLAKVCKYPLPPATFYLKSYPVVWSQNLLLTVLLQLYTIPKYHNRYSFLDDSSLILNILFKTY